MKKIVIVVRKKYAFEKVIWDKIFKNQYKIKVIFAHEFLKKENMKADIFYVHFIDLDNVTESANFYKLEKEGKNFLASHIKPEAEEVTEKLFPFMGMEDLYERVKSKLN